MEQKRRGNKDTQTSDAKFDEQFKLGHQMGSQVHIPWSDALVHSQHCLACHA